MFFNARNFIHVRTLPAQLLVYSSSDESLLNVCRSYTSDNVVRAVIYSSEGYRQRTQIKRKVEKHMDHTTCTFIVLTCGLILCCAGCCFPCYTKINPKLDEMSLCQHVQEQYIKIQNNDDTSGTIYTFTENTVTVIDTTIHE